MWKCFPNGRKFRNTARITRCSQKATRPAACTAPGEPPVAASRAAPIEPAGAARSNPAAPDSPPPLARRSAPSNTTSVSMRPRMKPRMSVPSQERVIRSGRVTTRRHRNPAAATMAASTTTSFTKA